MIKLLLSNPISVNKIISQSIMHRGRGAKIYNEIFFTKGSQILIDFV